MNFWESFKKPILCLAPMADVTDSAFRHTIAKYSKLNLSRAPLDSQNSLNFEETKVSRGALDTFVTYTEFVSADGLVLAPEAGWQKLLKDLEYSEIERPIVAQFFTSRPEMMEQAARLALELGFDGVDINMGCPDRSIEKQKAGAALIKNPNLAREIIRAAKAGTGDKIPVSVKTRLGYNKDELEEWLPGLLAENPAVIVIHARTRQEMSKVPARWERIKRAVEIRDQIQAIRNPFLSTDKILLNFSSSSPQSGSQASKKDSGLLSAEEKGDTLLPPSPSQGEGLGVRSKTLIIGNGDVENVADALKKYEGTGADGVMLGRAVFGNPFLFAENLPTPRERLTALVEHIQLFEKNLGTVKSFAVMKKHFKSYLKEVPESKNLKDKLMETENAGEAVSLVNNFLTLYS